MGNCNMEECPMWDGDTCPCDTFGLDKDNPPTRGTFTVEVPADDEPVPEWITLRQAAERVGKSEVTVRRWTYNYGTRLRVRTRLGTRQVYTTDLDALAATLPPGAVGAEVCADGGHIPDTPDWSSTAWTTAADYANLAHRSKRTILRWADEDKVRSARCACGRRRYIHNTTERNQP